jgi:hypothetical protein
MSHYARIYVAPEFQELSKQTIISLSVARRVADLKISGAQIFLSTMKSLLIGRLQ